MKALSKGRDVKEEECLEKIRKFLINFTATVDAIYEMFNKLNADLDYTVWPLSSSDPLSLQSHLHSAVWTRAPSGHLTAHCRSVLIILCRCTSSILLIVCVRAPAFSLHLFLTVVWLWGKFPKSAADLNSVFLCSPFEESCISIVRYLCAWS